ncbi:MAG: hypothetical protein ACI85K_000394, partial [Hyphomicrobiaceae bacterium]
YWMSSWTVIGSCGAGARKDTSADTAAASIAKKRSRQVVGSRTFCRRNAALIRSAATLLATLSKYPECSSARSLALRADQERDEITNLVGGEAVE